MSLDLGKLEGVTRRFDELNALLSSGELDGDGFSKLSREHAELAPVVEAIEAYKKLLNDLEEAEEILADPDGDRDMREMAEAEKYEVLEKLPEAERQMKLMLIPKDSADTKNAILEIRAGTGGEEAACLPPICIGCISAMPKGAAGSSNRWMPAKTTLAGSRKSSSMYRARTYLHV